MLHSYSPKYNDESNTDEWVNNTREVFQTHNPLFVSLLQGFSCIKLLQSFLLFLLVNIDQFARPGKQPHISQYITLYKTLWNLIIISQCLRGITYLFAVGLLELGTGATWRIPFGFPAESPLSSLPTVRGTPWWLISRSSSTLR